ncbi:hypothetical protein JOC34_000037 [Virgibacillus halotolerans]|nr:hypothetical protein [Virgibacillus halotolerans]
MVELLIIVGVVVSVQMGGNTNEMNEAIDTQLTVYEPIAKDLELDPKQSTVWAWVPFAISLICGMFLTTVGMIFELLNDIKKNDIIRTVKQNVTAYIVVFF